MVEYKDRRSYEKVLEELGINPNKKIYLVGGETKEFSEEFIQEKIKVANAFNEFMNDGREKDGRMSFEKAPKPLKTI